MNYKQFRSSHLTLLLCVAVLSPVVSITSCKTKDARNDSEVETATYTKTLTGEAALRADPNLILAAKLLKRPLSVSEMQAISRAHVAHGKDFTKEQIKNGQVRYTPQQLQDKYDIMAAAGLKKDEIKILMDHKIAGFFGDLAQAIGEQIATQQQEAWNKPVETTTSFFPTYNSDLTNTETRYNWVTGKEVKVTHDLFGNVVKREEQ